MNSSFYANDQHPRWEAWLASAGIAQSGIEVKTVDPDGNSVSTDDIGEVICHGDSVIPRYWNNPDATARTLRDGWLRYLQSNQPWNG